MNVRMIKLNPVIYASAHISSYKRVLFLTVHNLPKTHLTMPKTLSTVRCTCTMAWKSFKHFWYNFSLPATFWLSIALTNASNYVAPRQRQLPTRPEKSHRGGRQQSFSQLSQFHVAGIFIVCFCFVSFRLLL